jgi:hypothetical protein
LENLALSTGVGAMITVPADFIGYKWLENLALSTEFATRHLRFIDCIYLSFSTYKRYLITVVNV